MLIGEYLTKLGEKNRVAIPKKFRDEMGSDLIVAKGYEGCLILVTKQQWMEMTKGMLSTPYTKEAARDTARFIIGSANEVDADKQGRFVIPVNLKSFADMNKEVVFVGLMNWVEVWSKEEWDKRSDYLLGNSSLIAEKLEKLKVD
jgi:MraZ protein